jgi:subtilisin family serine protease
MKKNVNLLMFAILLVSLLGMHHQAQASAPNMPAVRTLNYVANKIDPALEPRLASLQQGDMLTVIVTLRQQADVSRAVGADKKARRQALIRILQLLADARQRPIKALLNTRQSQGKVKQVSALWIMNGLSVTASADVIQELANRPDVQSISADSLDIVPAALPAQAAPEPNLAAINAPAVWALGDFGQGVVVANMDSGVDITHPDLAATWRGGSNSWYDPYGQHPTTPTDMTGHGTATMGVMVGGDAGGTSIGVAPQAQWIAVKIFNDAGSGTATAIHLGFQWLLDPDGNPATDDGPQIVNNSWSFGTPGCNLEFQLDLQALRAAGIVPVFAAGNYGPSSSTSVSPANYPEAFAVGAVNNTGGILGTSSRGPSTCGQSATIYPKVSAPGVNIVSSDLFGFYSTTSGTSMAAPHVAGVLALLLNAYPQLDAAQQEAALLNSAKDLGTTGPDNTYGYGRIDVLAAYHWLATGGANPTPTATATSMPAPSDTPTALPQPSGTPTATALPSATPTDLPTNTPTALPSFTPTSVPTNTPTMLPSATPTATTVPVVNLALNKTVTVSSVQSSTYSGGKAVDGSLVTLWKTIRYTGKTRPANEWIMVDLGSTTSITRVILEWNTYYATSYTLQISNDKTTWSTVTTVTGANGANDTLQFTPVSGRYVRVLTTAWTDNSLRNWLNEIKIFNQ